MSDDVENKKNRPMPVRSLACYASSSKLAERLRWCRKVKGGTLRDVEAATGISNPYLSQLESGKIKEPGIYKMLILAHHYGVSLDELLEA